MYPASPPALPILPNPHQHQLFSPPLPPRTALTPMLRTWRSCRVASCAQHPFVGPMGADDADTDVEQTTRNTNLLGLDEGGVLSLLPKLCTQSNDTGTSTTPSSLARQYRLCWASSEHAGVSSNSPQPTRASPPSTHTHPLLVVLAITPTCVSARTMYARALPQLQIQTRHPLPMRITRLTAVGSSGAYRGATPVSSSLGPNNESLSRLAFFPPFLLECWQINNCFDNKDDVGFLPPTPSTQASTEEHDVPPCPTTSSRDTALASKREWMENEGRDFAGLVLVGGASAEERGEYAAWEEAVDGWGL